MAKDQIQTQGIQELKADLREKHAQRLYIFHGDETFLLHYYLRQMKKLLVDDLTESFNYHKLDKDNFDMHILADAVESLPMMAENTFVWVDDIDIFKLNEGDREKLSQLFADIPEYCTVVFTFETIQWKPDKRFKKFWDAIASNASIVEFATQEPHQLIPWIGRHFAAENKRISPDLCQYLIDITDGTMTTLAGEISKIAAYSGAENIVKSDIDAVTEPALAAKVFNMTDLLGAGNYSQALQEMQKLLKLQQKPIEILGAVSSHFRKLSTARTLLDNGKGVGDMMRICGIKEYPAKKIMNAARRFTDEFCKIAAELILETDRGMKTSLDDQGRLLELLILRLAQEARNG